MTSFSDFLSWEARTRDTLDVKKIYVDMAGGDVLAGIALSEIIFWHLPNKKGNSKMRVQREGYSWLAVPRWEWWERTRITPRQSDRVLKILRDQGLIITERWKWNNAPTVHIRINEKKFLEMWTKMVKEPPANPFLPDGEIGVNNETVKTRSLPDGEIDFTESLNLKTETTESETTTETTDSSDTPDGGQNTPPPAPSPEAQRTTVVDIHKVNGQRPEFDVYIGRANGRAGFKKSIWANPYRVKDNPDPADQTQVATAEEAVEHFREYLHTQPELLRQIPDLAGQRLGCWCSGPCHGDVLADLANQHTAGNLDLDQLVQQAKQNQQARPKSRRDQLYDMIAEIWFEEAPGTAAFAALGGRIGPHVSWALGNQITVTRDIEGEKTKVTVPGCSYELTPLLLQAAKEVWRKENPDAHRPLDVLKFIKHIDGFYHSRFKDRAKAGQQAKRKPATIDERMKMAQIVRYLSDNGRQDEAIRVTIDDVRKGTYDDLPISA